MKPEDVMGLAEASALYFRRLLDEGVPLAAAIPMASSFITALVLAGNREVERPWEEGV